MVQLVIRYADKTADWIFGTPGRVDAVLNSIPAHKLATIVSWEISDVA